MGSDRPRTHRHRITAFFVSLLVLLLVAVVVGAGVGWWTVQRSFPETSGRIEVAGLDQPAVVYRDDAGVPQVVAETTADLFFTQGWVHAQDRFWEMDYRRHAASGRLAELLGEQYVASDALVRTLGWRQVAEREVEEFDDTTRAAYEAYAAGVNAYLDTRGGADLSIEYVLLALQLPGYEPEPWTPADSVAWLKAAAWDQRANLDDELDRALLSTALPAEEVERLHPGFDYDAAPTIIGDPPPLPDEEGEDAEAEGASTGATDATDQDAEVLAAPLAELRARLDALPGVLTTPGAEIGSNSWVVDGSHTASELPLLAGDPHLEAALPSAWTQSGLRCAPVSEECPYEVSGFGFAGVPGIIAGHNAAIAWTPTNLLADTTDLYVERVDGGEYLQDDTMVSFEERREVIEVAGGAPVTITVRSTGHGPLVTGLDDGFDAVAEGYPEAAGFDDARYELALQWTGFTPSRTARAILEMNRAAGWRSFREAAERWDLPAQNLLFADVNGNIGSQAVGRVPVRETGDGTFPVPGWDTDYRWSGVVPFDEMPRESNPDRGYLVAANTPPLDAGDGPMLTQDWSQGYRAARIDRVLRESIDAEQPVSLATMANLQFDQVDPAAAMLLPALAELSLEGDAARGRQLLEDWDGVSDVDSAGAAYFQVVWGTLLGDMFAELPASTLPAGGDRWIRVVDGLLDEPEAQWWVDDAAGVDGRDAMLARALTEAWQEAADRMGSEPAQWRWGRLHQLDLRSRAFGETGLLPARLLLDRGPWQLGGSSAIVDATAWDARDGYAATSVPSMRMLVDLADLDASRWVNSSGASGHAFDRNYVDQTDVWSRGGTLPWPFTLERTQELAEHTLLMRPEGR
ncbi:penicillin amidase [Agromyces rhizosphaerae]|uniref:Penicillin amidase n=1 Tax=Agromyces rhizosphaerae TaxID=88374 RepID=A0A9W6CX60_9MICO|nr:penicillin acylase family protein [Agromyces rhizosphaerae]GLI28414.1 penicillin amidase [Agromyces rhizosphaerae]